MLRHFEWDVYLALEETEDKRVFLWESPSLILYEKKDEWARNMFPQM